MKKLLLTLLTLFLMLGGVARALGGAVNEGVVNLKCTVKNIEQDKNYYPNKPNIGKVIVYKIDDRSEKKSLTTKDFHFLYNLSPLKKNTVLFSFATINRNDRSFERSSIEIQNELIGFKNELFKESLPDIEKKYSGIDKFKKIAELHNFWFQGIKSVYPDQYLWRIEKGDCSVLGKL
jgi:hypothetical protein